MKGSVMLVVLFSLILQVLVSPASSAVVLTDPGPLCTQQTAALTCNITNGTLLQWTYIPDSEVLGEAVAATSDAVFPPSGPVTVLGVTFTVSQLMPDSPHLVSQISFEASDGMDGSMLRCFGGSTSSGMGVDVTLQVMRSIGPPSNVRLNNFMNGTTDSTVTIQWDPPDDIGGRSGNYNVAITPGPVFENAVSTQTTATVLYNTDYTVSISINSLCAQEVAETFTLVGCGMPTVPGNVQLGPVSATNEGAGIMYQCMPGFQPLEPVTAVCGNNGLWSPDPALHSCTVDCGVPMFPSSGNTSDTSNTTEGATVSFQCEEGFFLLSGSDSVVIKCTNMSNMGIWMPDPTTQVCRSQGSTSTVPANMSVSSTQSSTPPLTTNGDETRPDAGTGTDIVIPVVVVVVVLVLLTCIVIVVVIIICFMRHKRKATMKIDSGQNGLELQEGPLAAEYHTLQSRGYKADGGDKDEYSTLQHNSPVKKANEADLAPLGAEYSEVRADSRGRHGALRAAVDGAEYSQLNTNAATNAVDGAEYSQLNTNAATNNPSAGLVYADLGSAVPKSKNQAVPQHIPEDKVVYAAIDAQATAARQQQEKESAIPGCDLNMMLIQVKAEVTPLWDQYGEVLGVPQDILNELRNMDAGDGERLVEILDFWFRKFPRGAGPTWKEVALSLQEIGLKKLADDIMKVYTTGKLPIEVSDKVESLAVNEASPPPLPPKVDDSDEASLLPPKPKPRVGSLKQAPPRPPKTASQAAAAAVPARPPKSHQGKPAENFPELPPKSGY